MTQILLSQSFKLMDPAFLGPFQPVGFASLIGAILLSQDGAEIPLIIGLPLPQSAVHAETVTRDARICTSLMTRIRSCKTRESTLSASSTTTTSGLAEASSPVA